MKLTGFVKEIILYQNIKILNRKIAHSLCNRRCQKNLQKTANFFQKHTELCGEKKNSVFFILIYSRMSEYELVKKLGSYDNFKSLKSMVKVTRHKLFARNKLSAPTVANTGMNTIRDLKLRFLFFSLAILGKLQFIPTI